MSSPADPRRGQLEDTAPAVSQPAAQTEQLVFGRERSRHRFAVHRLVGQRARGRHAQRSGGHRVGHDALHAGDLVGVGGLIAGTPLPHHVGPDRAVGHLGAHVDGPAAVVEGVEVIAEALPVPGDALREGRARDVLDPLHQLDQPFLGAGAHRREADAAVAHDHGGDAVAGAGLEQVVPGGLAVVMGVDVHEAGSDDLAGGVDGLRRFAGQAGADGDDRVADHGHVGGPRRVAGAVHQQPATDLEVIHGLDSRGRTRARPRSFQGVRARLPAQLLGPHRTCRLVTAIVGVPVVPGGQTHGLAVVGRSRRGDLPAVEIVGEAYWSVRYR